MSNLMFRQKMITALEATGADGASITGTESEVNITLTFKREVSNGCSDGSACCRSSVVAPESKSVVDNELAGSNMELPQGTDPSPARRMWKRRVEDIGEELYSGPVTILPGHSAVEEIEREAYRLGEKYGYDNGLADGMSACRGGDTLAIDGVEPVVVDAFTWKQLVTPFDYRHSAAGHIAAYESAGGVISTPIRILMYHGIGPDGKRAGGRE